MFQQFITLLKKAPISLYLIYAVIYIPFGFAMNAFGNYAEIAKFTHWWQVFTCYGLYMIPISILLKQYPFFTQYAYGLVAMGVLEFLGYALQTSYVFPNNILDKLFQPQNFALAMALFFAVYFPLGNALVAKVHAIIFPNSSESL
ncbi:hypothetical protein [Cochleicola gelatinilyticus]|uniref:Uncharacterized protein n=1 Tax=Cochleicola gelatinilyticus TaxID=1763537 RepID=A0A167J4J9_9FLAO|nr:hypothetical protein [Cochleicola gelatinilyticus]OAB80334.1 hypothetical protein ULVI_06245 [Cochleicola gelatinilyticus]